MKIEKWMAVENLLWVKGFFCEQMVWNVNVLYFNHILGGTCCTTLYNNYV